MMMNVENLKDYIPLLFILSSSPAASLRTPHTLFLEKEAETKGENAGMTFSLTKQVRMQTFSSF